MSRAARFAWVGVAGFAVQTVILAVLAAAGIAYPVATALAVEAAIVHNFLWHERWTWGDRAAGLKARNYEHPLARFLRFNGATAAVSIVGNVGLMWLFVGGLRLPLLLANFLAVLSLGIVNFLAADRLVFVTKLTRHQNDPTAM